MVGDAEEVIARLAFLSTRQSSHVEVTSSGRLFCCSATRMRTAWSGAAIAQYIPS